MISIKDIVFAGLRTAGGTLAFEGKIEPSSHPADPTDRLGGELQRQGRKAGMSFVTTAPAADEGIFTDRHAAHDRAIGAERGAGAAPSCPRYSALRSTRARGIDDVGEDHDGPQKTPSSERTSS